MMSQFFQNLVDTDPWNLSGHCPSSLQQTWGESPGFTAPDLDRRGGHFLDREQSMSGHCPSQSTSGHCPSQGYSFYPTESSPGHIPCGFGSNQSATAIEAVSPCYQQIYSDITSGEALSQWTFQSSQGTQMEQPDVYHNTQFSLPQQSSPCNIHFQHGLQQNTYHPNVRNLLSNWKDEIYNSTQLPKYLSFDPSKSKWSDFYRKFEQYADDKHWSSQECKSNLKYVLHGKAADYMAYLNELVPDLTYYDFIMQMKKYMESQDLFDSQFEQWHRQRTFGNNTDCSCPFIHNSHDCTQPMGIQPQSSFQEPHWQSQEHGYRGYQYDSYLPFDCSGSNAMVHGPFQKIEMLSTGGPAQEMNYPENLSCGTLDTKEQFASLQVPPAAVQNGESHRRPIGRGVLHQGSSQDRLSSKHQIELEEICLPSKTKIDEGLKSEKRHAGNMEEGLVSLKSKSKKSASQPQSYQPIRESRPPQRERYRYMGSMASHPSAGSPKESKTKGTEEQLADIEKTLKLLVDALAIKPSAGGNFRSRTLSPSTAIAQGGRSLSPVRSLQGNEEDLVFDTARSHHEGIVPRCKQTLSSEDEASGEQNGEGSKGEPQGILWMTEEVDSRIPGLNPSDTNKANDQNSFILVDTDDWSLDQTEENTNISSLLLFPEEGKGIQKAHRDGMSVEELEKLLWPKPTELHLVQGDSMGIPTEIQESKSEITDFWWDSMGPTELGLGDEKESPENCEEYIDFMYDSLFGTSPLNKEIPSTLHEDEEWIDKTFKEMQIQQYAAWNPFMSLEGEMISVQYDRTTGDFPIGQINPPSSLRVPITLQDRSIKAVIDTAAMVTVISDQIYNEIKPNPPCLKATTLQTAGRNVKMVGRIIGPVSIKLGNVIFPTLVHVAPINNNMLLGLDFLLRIGAGINLKEQHLVVTGATEIVPLEIEYENRASHTISKITADEAEQSPAIIYNLQERSCHNLHPDEIYLPHTSYERPQKDTYCRERLDYPYLFNNQEVFGHADQGMVVSPVTMLKGISVLSTTGHTNQLETETKRRPELNCCICYRQEIALMTILKCIQGEQGLYQSKCLVKPKLSVLWFVEDERQWPWDPGGC